MRTLVSRPKGRFCLSDLLSHLAIACLAAAVLFQSELSVEKNDNLVTGSIQITVRPVSAEARAFREKEILCLAHNIYFEARGLDPYDQALAAHSVVVRLEQNKKHLGGNTVCGVVYHTLVSSSGKVTAMYSWTLDEDLRVTDYVAWQKALFIAEYVLDGKFTPPEHLRYMDHYLNPRTASQGNVCWFNKRLIPLERKGAHHYYRSPKNELDRLMLASQPTPLECEKTQQIAMR